MEFNHCKQVEKGTDSQWVEDVASITPLSSSDTESNDIQLDNDKTKKLERWLLRKIDLNILPLMALSMFVSFLVCCHVS